MNKILISSCFLGNKVRYDGNDNLLINKLIQQWQQEDRLVVICPELSGGLLTPRAPAEIQKNKNNDIDIKVITNTGNDVTAAFKHGANAVLRLCQLHGISYALLKESSPSCGSSTIYDGSFTDKKVLGQGITAKLLNDNGIKVYSEKTLDIMSKDIFLSEHR